MNIQNKKGSSGKKTVLAAIKLGFTQKLFFSHELHEFSRINSPNPQKCQKNGLSGNNIQIL